MEFWVGWFDTWGNDHKVMGVNGESAVVSALRASLTLPCSLVSSRTCTSCGGAAAKPKGAGGLSHWLYALEPRRSVDGQVVG